MSSPQVLSMRQAARELTDRHGLKVTHNHVSLLVRILDLPTYPDPANARSRRIDGPGFRKLDRFVARGRKVGA